MAQSHQFSYDLLPRSKILPRLAQLEGQQFRGVLATLAPSEMLPFTPSTNHSVVASAGCIDSGVLEFPSYVDPLQNNQHHYLHHHLQLQPQQPMHRNLNGAGGAGVPSGQALSNVQPRMLTSQSNVGIQGIVHNVIPPLLQNMGALHSHASSATQPSHQHGNQNQNTSHQYIGFQSALGPPPPQPLPHQLPQQGRVTQQMLAPLNQHQSQQQQMLSIPGPSNPSMQQALVATVSHLPLLPQQPPLYFNQPAQAWVSQHASYEHPYDAPPLHTSYGSANSTLGQVSQYGLDMLRQSFLLQSKNISTGSGYQTSSNLSLQNSSQILQHSRFPSPGAQNQPLPAMADRRESATYNGKQHVLHLPAVKNQCPVCHKVFKRPLSLQIHFNIHTGVKLYQCNYKDCGRMFNVKSNLTRHLKLHQKHDSQRS